MTGFTVYAPHSPSDSAKVSFGFKQHTNIVTRTLFKLLLSRNSKVYVYLTSSYSISFIFYKFHVFFSLLIGALMELDDRAKMETFMASHESNLSLPPTQDGETIFEYVVDSNGKHFDLLTETV